MKNYIAIIGLALALTSCLDREPISFSSEEAYFHTAEDFKLAANDLYQYLPKNNNIWGGLYSEDNKSDNQCSSSYYSVFLNTGLYKTQAQSNSNNVWNFNRLRAINYALNKMLDAESEPSDQTMAKQYIGEVYFFRAYEYYRLLRNYGDMPIVRAVQEDDSVKLVANAKRYPRNVVARFIIRDLEKAIGYLQETVESGRISQDAAKAFLSRVALYEGSWETYHAGTCFVPGNDKWPGHVQWPDPFGTITLPTVDKLPTQEASYQTVECSGSAEGEIRYFLTQAMNYAEEVADKHELDADYAGMFNKYDGEFSANGDVILARYYQKGVLAHSCSAFLKNGGGCGATRALVNTFLMKNGLPIYASGSGYKGDAVDTYTEFQNRDDRLTKSVRAAGDYYITKDSIDSETGQKVFYNDTVFYNQPYIYNSGNEKSTTGYDICKWAITTYSIDENVKWGGVDSCDMSESRWPIDEQIRARYRVQKEQRTQYNCTTAVPLIRAAECYLNYLEAYCMLNGNVNGGKCSTYWRKLRTRAGVDPDYSKTIAATDLSQENDLAVWSKGQEVSTTLYNIRRERRCEFIAEGMRFDDLKRWRALDKMVNYQPEGFRLWGTKNQELYSGNSSKWLSPDVVSQKGISEYLHPLQVNASSAAYNGYTFPKPHYLDPIPVGEFLLVISPDGVTPTSAGMSVLYQNPGWPVNADGPADSNYDCD